MRKIIGAKDFVKMFGEAKPHPKGSRQNVFGGEDALKVAPKLEGVDKTHKDIDLLKLRSIAVVHKWVFTRTPGGAYRRLTSRFTDEEVVSPDFGDKVREVVKVMVPFVHMWVTPRSDRSG
jgi:hypothetical protein